MMVNSVVDQAEERSRLMKGGKIVRTNVETGRSFKNIDVSGNASINTSVEMLFLHIGV